MAHVCLHCGASIATSVRGRPPSFCGDACRIDRGRQLRSDGEKRRGARVYVPCSGCQKPMQLTWSSAAVMTCNPCRRAKSLAKKLNTQRDSGPWHKRCALNDCHNLFVAKQPSRRFCSQDCLLDNHRAMERIRDAERRRQRQTETPLLALAWYGDFDAEALIAGPPTGAVEVRVRQHEWGSYDIRCAQCRCLCVFVEGSGDPGAWGCHSCYIKYALLAPPPGRPFGEWHAA